MCCRCNGSSWRCADLRPRRQKIQSAARETAAKKQSLKLTAGTSGSREHPRTNHLAAACTHIQRAVIVS